MKNCHNCGAPIEGNHGFCPYCGTQVKAAPPAQQAPVPQQQRPPQQQVPPQQQFYYNTPGYVPPQPPKKKNSGCLILGIISGALVVILLSLAVIGSFAYSSSSSRSTSRSSARASEPEESTADTEPDELSGTEAATDEEYSVVGSWRRYDAYMAPGYSVSQFEFLENGVVNWYENPGSENVVSGVYIAYQGMEALAVMGDSYESYLDWLEREAVEIEQQFGSFSLSQVFFVAIVFDTITQDGVTSEYPEQLFIEAYMRDDGQYCQTFDSGELGGTEDVYLWERM